MWFAPCRLGPFSGCTAFGVRRCSSGCVQRGAAAGAHSSGERSSGGLRMAAQYASEEASGSLAAAGVAAERGTSSAPLYVMQVGCVAQATCHLLDAEEHPYLTRTSTSPLAACCCPT